METIQLVDDVVKDLERIENLIKVKKLLLCASKNTWENDLKKLEAIQLSTLIKDLHEIAPTYGQLKLVLIQVVKKLNKKVQYFMLANTLIQKLNKLYPENLASRKRIRTQLKQLKKGVKYPYDLYDLKFKVARDSTLRRAKVLVFSALNYKFAYSTQDWATLDSLEFDEIVRALFYSCETPEDLEFRLYGTAACLDEPDKQIGTAGIIVDCLLPYYQYLQKGRDITDDADEDEPTAIDLKAPYNSSSSEDYLALPLNGKDAFEDDDEDDSCNYGFLNIPEFPLGTEDTEGRISDTIKKQLELEAVVKGLVEQRVNEVMAVIENSVRDLETYLEQNLEEGNFQGSIPLKYHSLKSFVKTVQFQSSKYLEILQTLEENERRAGKSA